MLLMALVSMMVVNLLLNQKINIGLLFELGGMLMKTANPLHMWDYWVEKYGFEYALEEYYPEALCDPRIHQALMNCKIDEQFIMREMRALASLEQDLEGI